MTELSQEDRRSIVQYRFINGLLFPTIELRIPGVSRNAARMVYTRARKRAKLNNIKDIKEATRILLQPSASKRVVLSFDAL